ncbi:hypothetical protein BJY01DRAFT_24351 [Aspergillus pseudoustus]|uniref:Uncharacterized protein n=1 Tax=Aspergillus pseudoustus TaxID=1810923 RepID=A0ABR4JLE9_9EURO
MPQENKPPKEGFMEKILDHHHHRHHHEDGDKGQSANNQPQGIWSDLHSDIRKDEAGLKEYLKKDEQMEEEGKTYGGLM